MSSPLTSTSSSTRSALAELAADGLLDVRDGWWRFRSDVVREVAYQTLTKQTRAARHAGVAAALRRYGATPEQLAHHSATASELVAELGAVRGVGSDIRSDAISDLSAAAAQALHEGRASNAHEYATRALRSVRWRPTSSGSLLKVRASSALEQRRFPEADRDARRIVELAIGSGRSVRRGRGSPPHRHRRPSSR